MPQLLLCEEKSSAEVHKEEKNSFRWSSFAADATQPILCNAQLLSGTENRTTAET